MMVIELRFIRRQGGKRAIRNRTLPCVVPGDLAMLAKGSNFLVEALLELLGLGTIFRRLGEGSKSILPKVTCVVEEDLFASTLLLSPCTHILSNFQAPLLVLSPYHG
jgi:hypothetical protein